jgi:hypothetical protein
MVTGIHRETAQILQFPLRPRIRLDNGITAAPGTYPVAVAVQDHCWYHEEAVSVELDESRPEQGPKPC